MRELGRSALPWLLASWLGIAAPLALADDAEPTRPVPVRAFTRVRAPDGIQIRRYNKTSGAQPGKKDRVVVHYHGTLKDGTVFDSSIERRRPANFRMDQVIPCWVEALTRLHVGEKAQLTCPPQTAYGYKGSPPAIPPNATLIFEIELLGVQ